MALNDVYSATVLGRLFDGDCLNVTHWQETAPVGGNVSFLLAAELQARHVGAILPRLSDDYFLGGHMVQRILPKPVLAPVISAIGSANGGVAGESLPAQDAIVLTKRTGFGGPRYRGRWFQSGLADIDVNGNVVAALSIPAFQASFDLYFAPVNVGGGTLSPVLFHKDTGSVHPITSTLVRPVIRCQRRRQAGKGS